MKRRTLYAMLALTIALACYVAANMRPSCTCVLDNPYTAVDVPEDCERHGSEVD